MTRREMIKGSVAAAALACSQFPVFGLPDPEQTETLIPFLDRLPANPNRPMIDWEQLTDWMTPGARWISTITCGQIQFPFRINLSRIRVHLR